MQKSAYNLEVSIFIEKHQNSILNFFILTFLSLAISCNPQGQKSLLSSGAECDTSVCTQSTATKIEGDLSIDPNSSQTTVNIEKGDIVEIAGTCKDLGRKNNRIIVEAFHVEDDESILPYVNNTISPNCQFNILGLLSSQQCFFVDHGNALVETGQLYPQCINGRFNFKVRLGSVSKSGATFKSYLVRMKLRTTDGITSESGWARTTVVRKLSPPTFTVLASGTLSRCEVKIEPYKFKDSAAVENIPNITYAIKRQAIGTDASGAQSPAAIPVVPADRLAGFFPADFSQIDQGDSIANFYDGGVAAYTVLSPTIAVNPQPGVKYNYHTQAQAGADLSEISTAKICQMQPPTINATTSVGGGFVLCNMNLVTGAVPGFNYYWAYSTIPKWTSNSNPVGTAISSCNPIPPSLSCTFDMTALGKGTYYVSVRTELGGFYGKWNTLEVPCPRP